MASVPTNLDQSRRATPRWRVGTRMQRADKMLRTYQDRMEVSRLKLMHVGNRGVGDPWIKCLEWQLAWENEILRYRDGNNDGKDNDNGHSPVPND